MQNLHKKGIKFMLQYLARLQIQHQVVGGAYSFQGSDEGSTVRGTVWCELRGLGSNIFEQETHIKANEQRK